MKLGCGELRYHNLGRFWVALQDSWRLLGFRGHLWHSLFLGPSSLSPIVLRASGAVLERSWAVYGLLGGPTDRFVTILLVSVPSSTLSRRDTRICRTCAFVLGMSRCLALRALSEIIWEHSWAVLEASRAVSQPPSTVVGLPRPILTLWWIIFALCVRPLGPFWGS